MRSRVLVRWCYDIAKGMQYLAGQPIMHGDLAARNILLCEDSHQPGYPAPKICDFGLSKQFYYENMIYTQKPKAEKNIDF